MSCYRFTDEAVADLNSIIDYTLEHWGTQQAQIYTDKLELCLNHLLDSPFIGKRRDELSPGLYSFPFQQHILFYLRNLLTSRADTLS